LPDLSVFGTHEVLFDGLVQHLQQWIIKSVDVQYDNRIQIQSELLPGYNFQQFFHCSASSGQGDNSVGKFINEKGLAKVVVALAKGKKQYDKREALKEKDDKRDMARAFKR
jgi:hypothetical protein